METKLNRIAEVASNKPKERFTSLIHLIDSEMITMCHHEMDGNKASGVDGLTKAEYEQHLEENVDELIARMKRQAYQPLPAKRVYIQKEDSDKMRPLGIAAYEDKLVQTATAKILNAVYEQDFLECSFGFRPGRGCHDALRVLGKILEKPGINYVVDTDVRSFFDNVDHEWMMKFLDHRIQDPNLQRLISRMLKAGIMEEGIRYDTPAGVPQGSGCAPILANLYLHHVVDLWFEHMVRPCMRGMAYMVRYADDIIFCFQYEEDAQRFYTGLKNRLNKFNLELSEEKTKFVKLLQTDGRSEQEGTFDFLGFTHYLTIGQSGRRVKRKTSKKRLRRSITRIKEWLRENRTKPIKEIMLTLNRKLTGTYNYYAVTNNSKSVGLLHHEARKLLFKWMNRRSQRKSFDWNSFAVFLKKYPLKRPKVQVDLRNLGAGASYVK